MLNIAKHKSSKEPTVAPPSASRALTQLEEMERYIADLEDRMFGRRLFQPIPWPSSASSLMPFEERTPHVDVIDRDDVILVEAELPGIEKKDLDISVSDSAITLKAECSREKKEESGEYYRHEISYSDFSRTIPLPCAVNLDKAKATFKDGILELTLPKMEKTERKRIKVD